MNEQLIAPCGMNCSLCSGYLAFKHDIKRKGLKMPYCTGCRPRNKQCSFLKKRCDLLIKSKVKYCYECPDFPCKNLSHLDGRYSSLYRMSMVENLGSIKDSGLEKFLFDQAEKWRCPECGDTICCHNGICYGCSLEKLRHKKVYFRWEEG